MAQLPPPRPPGQPPDRPPIRRPGDHLPMPDQFGPSDASLESQGRSRKRAFVTAGVVALVALVGVSAVVLLGRDGDELNTEAAAVAIDDALRDADDVRGADCPIDDPLTAISRAVDPIDDDALYDVIDLGDPLNSSDTPDDDVVRLLCGIVDPQAPGDVDIEGLGLVLSEAPSDFVEYSEQNARDDRGAADIDELEGFSGGSVYHQIITNEDEAFVDVTWVNEDIAIGVLIAGNDVEDYDPDALRRGLIEIVPSVVDELAADADDD